MTSWGQGCSPSVKGSLLLELRLSIMVTFHITGKFSSPTLGFAHTQLKCRGAACEATAGSVVSIYVHARNYK